MSSLRRTNRFVLRSFPSGIISTMIPVSHRFRGHNSLRFVYSNGKTARARIGNIKYITNPHRKHSRVAVVVSKKVIKSAIGRNRIRRRVYEYARTVVIPQLPRAFDIVVIVASADLATMPYDEFKKQFDQLVSQTDLYKTAQG